MSRVSIYMSSYNYAQYLPESINSVLNQTYTDYELFILDDASTDSSWSIIQGYKDPRIHAHQNVENRNDREWMKKVVFEMATGEYIAIHHSDNLWEPEKLQKQVDILDNNPEIGAVFTHLNIIDEKSLLLPSSSFYYKVFNQPNRSRFEWLNYFFYKGNALCHPSILIRKECYDRCGFYRDGLRQISDFDMWVRLCLNYEIFILQEKLMAYRVMANQMNMSGNNPATRIRSKFEHLQVLDNYLKIQSPPDFITIFPHAEKYLQQNTIDIGFALGMTALETRNDNPIYCLFGLQQLFNALNDPDRKKVIAEVYHFTHKDFVGLSAKHDIFSGETAAQIKKVLANKTWKSIFLLGRISETYAPNKSLTYRILRFIYKTLKLPLALLKRKKHL